MLKHDKKRQKIAENGQKRTFIEHTYKMRVKELAAILNQYL